MERVRVSICIPTLNRGAFIGETLESIVSQATDDVEIVIVDGGSTDNTKKIVSLYQQRFPRLRYIRSDAQGTSIKYKAPSAGGFDRDCDRAVELARGEYCWLFTDDDLLKPGAVRRVLNATKRSYGLVIANAEVRGLDLTRVLAEKMLHVDKDRTYKPTESQELFVDTANYLSFVGGVVIRRDLWLRREREKYFGTAFVHVGVIFQGPLPADTLVIAEPLVTIRYGNALYRNSSRFFTIWMFDWPGLLWSFPHFSESAKSRVIPREPWRGTMALLLWRAQGSYSRAEYARIKPCLTSARRRLIAKWVAVCPAHVLNVLALAYYSINGRRFRAERVDLRNSPFYFGRALSRFLGARRTHSSPLRGTQADTQATRCEGTE